MLVIPIASHLYKVLQQLAESKRMIFFTGVPGVGKSLLIQQLALIANAAGRTVHLLQYNLAREPFETEVNISKYPEIEGVTDPAIRKAVGLWAREAVVGWHERHSEAKHLLIGELPLIGNRLVELVEVHDDSAEELLRSETAAFVIPVPSWEVREVIEARRAETSEQPQHEKERLDAPPNVLRQLWEEVNGVARQIGLTKANPDTPYNPYIYGGVFMALLQHRQSETLLIEEVLRPTDSVYEMAAVATVLRATSREVNRVMGKVEAAYSPEALAQVVSNWHAIVTANPEMPDRGPELRLPLPQQLTTLEKRGLSQAQQTAVLGLLQLPLEMETDAFVAELEAAMGLFGVDDDEGDDGKTAVSSIKKHGIYDSYFNVHRTDEDSTAAFVHGLLQSYCNVLCNLKAVPHNLTVVELPLLRMALETGLRAVL